MPGLSLTCPQAARLWNLERSACRDLLDSLAHDGFLHQRHDGAYSRLTDGPLSARFRMLKADAAAEREVPVRIEASRRTAARPSRS
jgi:hypothetical protein